MQIVQFIQAVSFIPGFIKHHLLHARIFQCVHKVALRIIRHNSCLYFSKPNRTLRLCLEVFRGQICRLAIHQQDLSRRFLTDCIAVFRKSRFDGADCLFLGIFNQHFSDNRIFLPRIRNLVRHIFTHQQDHIRNAVRYFIQPCLHLRFFHTDKSALICFDLRDTFIFRGGNCLHSLCARHCIFSACSLLCVHSFYNVFQRISIVQLCKAAAVPAGGKRIFAIINSSIAQKPIQLFFCPLRNHFIVHGLTQLVRCGRSVNSRLFTHACRIQIHCV